MKLRRLFHTCLLALSFNTAALTTASAQKVQPGKYAEIAIDAETGKVLSSVNADKKLHPASTTKIMTAYLVFEALKSGRLTMDQKLKVSKYAAFQERSNLGMYSTVAKTVTIKGKKVKVYSPGPQKIFSISVRDALQGLLVESGNDVAVVFAEALGGSQAGFAKLMNDKAKQLGMDESHFSNPNGLTEAGHLTSVSDMAVLSRAIIRDFPEYYHYFGQTTFAYNGQVFTNHNKMLNSYDGMDGLKTGYTAAAGCNLAASATRDGRRVIGVVFGAPNGVTRTAKMARLLNEAFNKIAAMPPDSVPLPRIAASDSLPPLVPPYISSPDSVIFKFPLQQQPVIKPPLPPYRKI